MHIDSNGWRAALACPLCHGRLDEAFCCTGCGHAYGTVAGRPRLLCDARPVVAKENAVIDAQRRARTSEGRTGLRGLADRVRSKVNAEVFAEDGAQVRLLTERLVGTLGDDALVLDVGACEQYYRASLERLGTVLALDVAVYDATDVVGDAHRLPFRDGSLAAVSVIEVLEHLERPWEFFAEAARVLRPGGVLFGVAPQYCPSHGFPYDFFRYTRGGLESLARRAGFATEALWPLGGAWGTLLHWYWANHARENSLRSVPGVGVAYHAWFQGVAWALDRLDARAGYGEKPSAREQHDHVGWSFVFRKGPARGALAAAG